MRVDVNVAARGKWRSILLHYGVHPSVLSGKHCACPMCGGKDRFRFSDFRQNGNFYCNQCGSGAGFDLLFNLTGKSFKELASEVLGLVGQFEVSHIPSSDDAKKNKTIAWMKELAARAQPLSEEGTVTAYLHSRGLYESAFLKEVDSLTYYHASGKQSKHPAMLGALRDVNGVVRGMHMTYLTPEGKKADLDPARKVRGYDLSGCAIRLSDVQPHIGIAEGIETAMSVTALYDVPCWAAYSANNLESFAVPEGVERVTIYADADKNFVGQRSAMNLAARLYSEGVQVDVAPLLASGDYNDQLMKRISYGRLQLVHSAS